MRVELAYTDPAREVLIGFDVRPGSSVLDCVECSGLFDLIPGLRDVRLAFAVFGRRVEPTDPVSEGDRIEILRPLEVDPKEARRLRARRAGGARSGAGQEYPIVAGRKAPLPPGEGENPSSRVPSRDNRMVLAAQERRSRAPERS